MIEEEIIEDLDAIRAEIEALTERRDAIHAKLCDIQRKLNKVRAPSREALVCPDCGEPIPDKEFINLRWHCPKCGWD